MVYRVAADIGGTFTDIVIENISDKTFSTIKVLSTPQNQAIAVLEGLRKNVSNINEIDFIVHGTTVGLNSFLERKGARVLLVMTAGISDTYTIARGDRKELYNVQYTKPEVLVPRKDVVEVRERMQWNGDILTNINVEDINVIINKINDEDINAVAICFLHSYVNPAHELKARELIQAKVKKDVVISLSHTVAREWR